jgi:hypothetical protein
MFPRTTEQKYCTLKIKFAITNAVSIQEKQVSQKPTWQSNKIMKLIHHKSADIFLFNVVIV